MLSYQDRFSTLPTQSAITNVFEAVGEIVFLLFTNDIQGTNTGNTASTRMTTWTDLSRNVLQRDLNERPSSLEVFRDEFAFADVPNWDGAGAKRLDSPTIELAQDLVSRFASTDYLVEVCPGKDGSLAMTWDDDDGNYVYVDVGPGETVHLFYDVVGLGKWEGVSIATDPRMVAQLTSAFRFLRPANLLPIITAAVSQAA